MRQHQNRQTPQGNQSQASVSMATTPIGGISKQALRLQSKHKIMRAAVPIGHLLKSDLHIPAAQTVKLSDSLLDYQQFEKSPSNKGGKQIPLATFGRLNSTLNESCQKIQQANRDLNQTDIYLTQHTQQSNKLTEHNKLNFLSLNQSFHSTKAGQNHKIKTKLNQRRFPADFFQETLQKG